MHDILFVKLPLLLPCEKCRNHFNVEINNRLRRVRGGKFTTWEEMFEWLWAVKNKVNVRCKQQGISLHDLKQRFRLHGRLIDEVALADTLVIMAMYAAKDAALYPSFVQMCDNIAQVLPDMSNLVTLKKALATTTWNENRGNNTRNNVALANTFMEDVTEAAISVRSKRGCLLLTIDDYREIVNDSPNSQAERGWRWKSRP